MKSLNEFVSSNAARNFEQEFDGLSSSTYFALPWIFTLWAHAHQIPPNDDYRNWALIGGRAAGKTRAGAEWVRSLVEGAKPKDQNKYKRIALIGQSLHEVQEVMIFGPSGIMACTPPDRRPIWNASRKRLLWPNGAEAFAYSAHEPDTLRGPQFDAAWLDEFAKWPKAQSLWDMLQFGMRLGARPKIMITTTPKPSPILQKILADEATVMTQAPTYANRAYLPDEYLDNLEANYLHSNLAQEEIYGEFSNSSENALWRPEDFQRLNTLSEPFDRIAIAVDPSVSSKDSSNETGIIVAGAIYPDQNPKSWRATVIEDATLSSVKPEVWCEKVLELYHSYDASLVVAEVNQGGDLVESMLRTQDPFVNYYGIHARQSKSQRAETVSALYRQGRVTHATGLRQLEAQMMEMGRFGYEGQGSPDRVDACVWALQVLLLDALKAQRPHQIRSL